MRASRLAAQAFRGFPDHVEIPINGDVVLLYGDNGTGKSSLAELFEWALFGTIVRKDRAKSKSEYQGWSWLRSVHSPADLPTLVEVDLVDDDGSIHTVRRELDGSKTRLTIDGSPADSVRSLGISTEPALRPFLGQCEIQALIDSEQQDRWEQLSAILGFGDFGRVRSWLQRLRTDADSDSRVVAVRDRAGRALHDLVRQGEDPLAQDPEDLRRRAARLMRLDEAAAWGEIGAAAKRELHDLYALNPRPAALESLVFPRTDLDAAATRLRQAIDVVLGEIQVHRQWHRENQQATFFSEGLRLSPTDDPELCPFCGARTLTGQVPGRGVTARHLRA